MSETGQVAPRQTGARPATPLGRWLIRVRAYFRKEVNELRRQPLLVLSLIGGPLLVLIIFGASFQSSSPLLRTVIVVPPGGVSGVSAEQISQLAGTNFMIEGVTEDRTTAEARLRAGQLDVVQILPADAMTAVRRGESPAIEFLSNAINPMTEGWVQYLAYAEVNEINKALLKQETASAQQEAASVRVKIGDANGQISELQGSLSQQRRAEIQQNLRDLRQVLAALEARLPVEGALGNQADVAELRRSLVQLDTQLGQIDQAISAGALEQRLDELRNAQAELLRIDSLIELFVDIPPDTVVSPLRQKYSNIRGGAYAAVVYYAPGVLALLVQHTAITLGALALVRERLMGAFEVFRVAPVSMTQLLIGKYLGYTLFIGLTALVLLLAMLALGVPLLGSPWLFGALMLLLTVASLGVGFLISTVSSSDSQAIQLAMITLLLSIFFSGFFIGLDSFARPVLLVSYAIPMTHGVAGFQALMLRGLAPDTLTWAALALIAVATFVLVVVLTRRQFARA